MDDSANTIVVIGKSDPAVYVACVVLATTRLDVNKAVRTRLGVKKASFASGEQTVEGPVTVYVSLPLSGPRADEGTDAAPALLQGHQNR